MKYIKNPQVWTGSYTVTINHQGILHRYRFACERPICFYVGAYKTEEMRDKQRDEHPCPWFSGGTTTFSWSLMSEQYIQPIWEMLDAEVVLIKGDDPTVKEEARAKARAYANTLALLMQPFFTEANQIVKEAIRRYDERSAGRSPETPGMGHLHWKRPSATVGDPSHPSWQVGEYDPKNPTKLHSLSDEDVTKIKASTAFPIAILAAAYEVSEKAIKAIWEE